MFSPARSMRWLAAVASLLGGVGVHAAQEAPSTPSTQATQAAPAAAPAQAAPDAQVERGRYLAHAGDCVSCHTVAGGRPYAGGRPLATGFGVLYTPNITPDKDTGIGSWSAQAFYDAMHSGRDDEGTHLYPAFPYPWFTKVSRADVQAIKAYLDTLAPVKQANKPPELSWWLGWRGLMAGWNLINFHAGEFRPDAAKSAQWNRGAYLVEGLGHCADCHTPKRPFGGAETSNAFEGGLLPAGWYAPALTGDLRAGLGQWTVAEIVEYLKTGATARTAAAGPMAEVVANSTSHLSDADLSAIATYLKDMPAANKGDAKQAPLGAQALARGQAVFADNCAACHMADGGGQAGVFPSLMGSSTIQAKGPETVIRIVLQGARVPGTPGKPTGLAMPAFAWKLDDAQVGDVVSYIRNAWGNRASPVNADAVADMRRTLAHSKAQR